MRGYVETLYICILTKFSELDFGWVLGWLNTKLWIFIVWTLFLSGGSMSGGRPISSSEASRPTPDDPSGSGGVHRISLHFPRFLRPGSCRSLKAKILNSSRSQDSRRLPKQATIHWLLPRCGDAYARPVSKIHQLETVVSSSLLIRLQSSWYLSWLALPETSEYRKSYVRRWDLPPPRRANAKRLSRKIHIDPPGRCTTPVMWLGSTIYLNY